MAERRQRINVTFSQETLDMLDEKISEKQRSSYIEGLVRKDLGMPEAGGKTKGFAAYEKDIDYGQGVQVVRVRNGKVIRQSISAKQGFYHSYTGDGNPEWVGQDVSVIYGQGFKRIRGTRLENMEIDDLQSDIEDYDC